MKRRIVALVGVAALALAAGVLMVGRLDHPEPGAVEAGRQAVVDRPAGPQARNMIPVTGRPGRHASGSPGDDKLMDRTGGSTLAGGIGDDTYQAPDERTHIVERAGEGNDTIETWNSFRVPPQVENLVLVGEYGTGTAAAGGSRLTSKGLANVLESGPGSDTLVADPGAVRTVFLFHPHSGMDLIRNFRAAGDPHDFIRLTYPGLCDAARIRKRLSSPNGRDTLLTLGASDQILIEGVRPEALTTDDFLLCYAPDPATLSFQDGFDRLSLHDRITGTGRWSTAYAHAPADGAGSREARRLSGNHDEQIYVDPAYAGDPAVSRAPLGLDPFGVRNGILTIRASRLSERASASLWHSRFASGLLTSQTSFSQTYGYFEIRAELPQVRGMFPAFWLLPASRTWPPEIDVFENVGRDFVACGMVAPGSRTAFFVRFHGGVRGMHRYGVLWTPRSISWVFDGQVVGRAPTPPALHQPMYLILNLAVGGKWPGAPAPAFRSADMRIDYVRAYRWSPREKAS